MSRYQYADGRRSPDLDHGTGWALVALVGRIMDDAQVCRSCGSHEVDLWERRDANGDIVDSTLVHAECRACGWQERDGTWSVLDFIEAQDDERIRLWPRMTDESPDGYECEIDHDGDLQRCPVCRQFGGVVELGVRIVNTRGYAEGWEGVGFRCRSRQCGDRPVEWHKLISCDPETGDEV